MNSFVGGTRGCFGCDYEEAPAPALSFHVREITPTLKQHVTAKLTYPYRLITIPRTTKHLRFVVDGRP